MNSCGHVESFAQCLSYQVMANTSNIQQDNKLSDTCHLSLSHSLSVCTSLASTCFRPHTLLTRFNCNFCCYFHFYVSFCCFAHQLTKAREENGRCIVLTLIQTTKHTHTQLKQPHTHTRCTISPFATWM